MPEASGTISVVAEVPFSISWNVVNQRSTGIEKGFFIDLQLDGVLVERWAMYRLGPGESAGVQGWDRMAERVRLTPGEHTLKLVVDSTNLLDDSGPENDRGQANVSVPFTWAGPELPPRPLLVKEAHLPNLTPFTPEDWESPIRVISKNGAPPAEARLGDIPLQVQIAYQNNGLSSINRSFSSHLFLDDTLVARYQESSLISQEKVVTPEWPGLEEAVRITPGWHTLKLVVDATNVVLERDERDNTYVREFYWGNGKPAETGQEALPVAVRLPSLKPITPPGWDGPITVSQVAGIFSSPELFYSEKPSYLHWAIANTGTEDLKTPYAVTVWLDGEPLAQWERPGLKAGARDVVFDWPLKWAGSTRFVGPHRLALEIRLPQRGQERSQEDTRVYRDFLWTTEAPPLRAPVRYGSVELRRQLDLYERLTTSTEITRGASQLEADVLAVADAVYYSLHGRSLKDEDLTISFLNDKEYKDWVDMECQDRLENLIGPVREDYRSACGRLAGFAGFQSYWKGHQRIVIRAERPPLEVLLALAHELGHFRQSTRSPGSSTAPDSLDLRALQEAQAYAYELFFLRKLESLVAYPLFLYPRLPGFERFSLETVTEWFRDYERSEHARAKLLLWLAVLQDWNLSPLRAELLTNKSLSVEGARRLYSYLLVIPPYQAEAYVSKLFQTAPSEYPAIRGLLLDRLVSGLPYWSEGSPYLREAGLLP
ncbi:MAG: hypothetical protein HYY31_04055 [Chloroflexi bacterium]|nr:hypothetical protein [Chloroflexota bacterium]